MRSKQRSRVTYWLGDRVKGSAWKPGLILVILALATPLAIIIGHNPHSQPVQVVNAAEVGTPVPEAVGLQGLGIRYDAPTIASNITPDQAIQAAEQWLGTALTAQSIQTNAKYVLFSDDQYYSTDAQGQKHFEFQQIPAWVVTFDGLSIPSRPPPGKPIQYNHQENVIINAMTGAYMEAFSYQ